jgi:hypothetical protein
MRRFALAVAAAGLVVGSLTWPGSAAAPVEPAYLRSRDARVIAAIYTPFVWNALSRTESGLANPPEATATGAQDSTVIIAFREPGAPRRVPLSDQPWKLALVDAGEALSWDQPTAQHPVWHADAAGLARQSGVAGVANFTVAGGFRPSQFMGRKFVILYRTAASDGGRYQTEFVPHPLPDLATLRWKP